MSTFNQFLDDQHERQDKVGEVSRYWRSLLPGRPRVHAPTGVLNHLRQRGAEFTPELEEGYKAALMEYQALRAPQGSRMLTGDQDPAQAIVSLGQIADAFRDTSRRLARAEALLEAIAAGQGIDVAAIVVGSHLKPAELRIAGPVEQSEPLSAQEWAAAAEAADWTAAG